MVSGCALLNVMLDQTAISSVPSFSLPVWWSSQSTACYWVLQDSHSIATFSQNESTSQNDGALSSNEVLPAQIRAMNWTMVVAVPIKDSIYRRLNIFQRYQLHIHKLAFFSDQSTELQSNIFLTTTIIAMPSLFITALALAALAQAQTPSNFSVISTLPLDVVIQPSNITITPGTLVSKAGKSFECAQYCLTWGRHIANTINLSGHFCIKCVLYCFYDRSISSKLSSLVPTKPDAEIEQKSYSRSGDGKRLNSDWGHIH